MIESETIPDPIRPLTPEPIQPLTPDPIKPTEPEPDPIRPPTPDQIRPPSPFIPHLSSLFNIDSPNIHIIPQHFIFQNLPEEIIENPIIRFLKSQDFRQKVNMTISVSLELYRVMVSSLLIVFVPQKCNDHVCNIAENMRYDDADNTYFTGLILNYTTACIMVLMYIVEIYREDRFIKFLEVNNTISADNESVGNRIQLLPEYKQKQLYHIVYYYQSISFVAILIFIVNTIMSGMTIYKYSLGNQTALNFITNILFMISKMTNVISIINTEKNIFFSAYLNTKVQFNDLDPHEYKKLANHHDIHIQDV